MVAEPHSPTLAERVHKMEPVAAPPEQQAKVVELDRVLRQILQGPTPRAACKLIGANGEQVEIPEAVFHFVMRVAEVLAKGDAVTVVPVGKLLTTQQAADILNMSRQHLVDLLEKNEIAHHRVGRHRRIRIEDLLGYKALRDARRSGGLRSLVQMTEDFGGYPELEATTTHTKPGT